MLGIIFLSLYKILRSIASTLLNDSFIQNSVKIVELILVNIAFDED